MDELKNALTNHAKKSAYQTLTLRATIKSVDKSTRTCTVELDNGIEIDQVLIQPISSLAKGMVVYPAVNSKVILEKIESQDLALRITGYTEIAEIEVVMNKFHLMIDEEGNAVLESNGAIVKMKDGKIDIESATMNVDCNDIVFNGGANLGLVKASQLAMKLNLLETMMNTHTHLIVAPIPGTPVSPNPVLLTPTVVTELTNDNIKH